jgi:hypothetical protein
LGHLAHPITKHPSDGLWGVLLYKKLTQSKEKTMSLPQLLPLPEAARKLGVSVSELRARVDAGTIAAGVLPDGEIVVSKENLQANNTADINTRLSAIKREGFEHLRGQAITVTEAAEKYEVPRNTILEWAKQHITILKPGYRMELDEADVAYCVAIYAVRKQYKSLAPLLDDEGNPYLLKHPDLARARRMVSDK